jgi:hypothetical protein
MGRSVGSFIKDLKYDKFWVISFSYRNGNYVLCKNSNRINFLPINLMTFEEASKANIIKFNSKDDAKKALTKIPKFDMNGNEVIFEVLESSIHEYLIGL